MSNGCGAKTSLQACDTPRMLTISERLYQQKKDLEARLVLINDAIEAMNKVPDFQNALDAISKVGLY